MIPLALLGVVAAVIALMYAGLYGDILLGLLAATVGCYCWAVCYANLSRTSRIGTMIEKPESAARVIAEMLLQSSYADEAAERNAITRRLLEFYDAGQSTALSRIERLEGLLMRIKPWLALDAFADLRREIDEVLRHD